MTFAKVELRNTEKNRSLIKEAIRSVLRSLVPPRVEVGPCALDEGRILVTVKVDTHVPRQPILTLNDEESL